MNSELWHACAGPLVSLPVVGSRVVYFPQGHSEQVSKSITISEIILVIIQCFNFGELNNRIKYEPSIVVALASKIMP